MLLTFTMPCSELKIKFVTYIVHLQGNSKEFRYIKDFKEKLLANYFNNIIVLSMLKFMHIIEVYNSVRLIYFRIWHAHNLSFPDRKVGIIWQLKKVNNN